MSRRKNDDHVIHFTPETGFRIEALAPTIVQAMHEMDMDAQIHLPGSEIIIDIERDCTAKEIVKGYKDFVQGQVSVRIPSNKNERQT